MPNMSQDRVEFFISRAYGSQTDGMSKNANVAIEAAMLAFNVDRSVALKWHKHGWRVVARPSQFARFLFMRDLRGGQNAFKQLEPVHHTTRSEVPLCRRGHKYKKVVDVSGNPHCKDFYNRVVACADGLNARGGYVTNRPVQDTPPLNMSPDGRPHVNGGRWELGLDVLVLHAGDTWVSQGGTRVRIKEETTLSGPELAGFRQMGFKRAHS